MKKNYLKMFLLSISLLFVANTYVSAQASIVLSTIKVARTKGINEKVRVRGMVTVTPTTNSRNEQRALQDPTGGLNIFAPGFAPLQALTKGDSVEIVGQVAVQGGIFVGFNGLFQLVQIPATTPADPNAEPFIRVISSGNPLPPVKILTIAQLHEPAIAPALDPFVEQFESMLVRVENVVLVNNTNTVFSAGSGGRSYFMNADTNPVTFTLTGANPNLPVLRITPGNSMNGQDTPSGSFSCAGVLGQFRNPTVVGAYQSYQITPNGFSDFEVGFALSNFKQASVTSTSINLAWNTNIDAKATIRIGAAPVDIANTVYTNTITQTNFTKNGVVELTGLLPATLYTIEVKSQTAAGRTVIIRDVFVTASESTGEIKVFFNSTTPTGTCSGTNIVSPPNLSTDIDGLMASYIDKALFTIEIAVYNSNSAGSPKIIAALNAAGARGVQVRYIYDSSNANTALGALITTANVKKMADRTGATSRDGIMHNKFIVIDASTRLNSWVVTGSANHTDNNLNKAGGTPSVPNAGTDPNNILFIQDQALARTYTQEFNEMWGIGPGAGDLPQAASKFGANKSKNTPTSFVINQKNIEIHFSPTDAVSNNIRKNLYTTNNDLRFALLLVTDVNLGNVIDSLQNTGIRTGSAIDVKGIIDEEWVTSATGLVPSLRGRGVNIQTYLNANRTLHHKYAIIDAKRNDSDPIVITGSHNWSNGADVSNDENTLIIHDGAIAREYLAEFGSRWFEATGLCDAYLTAIDNTKTESVVAYPNPNNGKFSIRFEEMIGKTATISVRNLNGQTMFSSKTTGEAITELDAQNLATGMYLLEIELNGVRTIKKIIVNK